LNLYLGTLLAAAGLTFAATPLWRAWCHRFGWMDAPGHRKLHHSATPLAGGPAIFSAMLLSLLGLWAALRFHWSFEAGDLESLEHALAPGLRQFAAVLGGALGMTFLGGLDDRIEMRPAWKFIGQLIIASLVAAGGVRITLFVPNLVFSYVVTVLWILTVTNAFNFMDNMNGLCPGLAAIAGCLFGVWAAASGQPPIAGLAFLLAGACLGFLPWNFPRASAFLGDAGSHLLGFLLAALSILPSFYSKERPHHLAVLAPLLILAVPLADLGWVVLLRWRRGQPFYVGDTNHLSHRLVQRGLSPVWAVALIWLLAAVLGGLTFLL
jgi:UDP-GlcNAc:undecaprenyl-phosphate GlcNAc-1-phosphate transferase